MAAKKKPTKKTKKSAPAATKRAKREVELPDLAADQAVKGGLGIQVPNTINLQNMQSMQNIPISNALPGRLLVP